MGLRAPIHLSGASSCDDKYGVVINDKHGRCGR